MDSMKNRDLILTRLCESRDLLDLSMSESSLIEDLNHVAKECIARIVKGGKVVFFGNGGSAADAQHLAAELVGRYLVDRPAIPSLALTTDTSVLTSISNDYAFDSVFSRQVEALVTDSDVAVGISTSGNSENVVLGLEASRKKGALSVSFTGREGGRASEFSDYCLRVPSDSTPLIQQMHITLGHILCELIEASL